MPRVIERFGGKHRHLGRCLIFAPEKYHEVPPNLLPNFMEIGIPATKWLRDYNCSISEGPMPVDYFIYYPNGSYTGPLGMLQRSEIDSVPYVARPDSLPHNPVLIGKVFTAADVAIGFRKKAADPIERELTSFVTDFPGIVYVYVLIALFIFIILFITFENKKNQPLTKRLAPKNIAHLIEQIAYCLVDQMNLDAATSPGRLLLVSLHILLVVFIYGLFLSKIGADLVVMKEPYNIQSVEDIIEPDSQTKPVVLKQLFLKNLMKQASVYRPESTLAKLYTIIMSDPENNTVGFNMDDIGTASSVFDGIFSRIMERKSAMLMPIDFFTWFRHFQCTLNPVVMSKVQTTKETFAHGILTFVLAPKIHPMVRKVLDYFTGCYVEMSLIKSPMLRNVMTNDFIKLFPGAKITSKVLQCQDISQGMSADESEDSIPWRPFYVHDYLQVLYIMALFLTLAAIVLLMEQIWSNYEKNASAKLHESKNKKIHEQGKKIDSDRWKRLKQVVKKKGQEKKRLRVTQLPRMKPRRHYIHRHLYMEIFQHPVMQQNY